MWEKTLIRALVLVSIVILAWAALTIGAASGEVDLRAGELATRNYVAQRSSEVVDEEASEALRSEAAARVESVTTRDESIEQQVNNDLSQLFEAIRAGVLAPEPEWVGTLSLPPTSTTTTTLEVPTPAQTTTAPTLPPTTTLPPPTVTDPPPQQENTDGVDDEQTSGDGQAQTGEATTTATTEATPTTAAPTTTIAPAPSPSVVVTLTGRIFLDFDSDAALTESGDTPDLGLELVTVRAVSPAGEGYDTQTQANGDFILEVPEGVWDVVVDIQDDDIPSGFTIYLPLRSQTVTCLGEESACGVEPVPFIPLLRAAQLQNQELIRSYPQLNTGTVATLVEVAMSDVIREVSGIPRAWWRSSGRRSP